MEYDVNIILMGLVIFLVLSMIMLVVYYRMTYEDLNVRYRLKMLALENTTKTLNSTMMRVQARDEELSRIEKQLRDYASELNLSQSRESVLGDHFTKVKGEKEEVEDKLNKTSLERARYESMYNKYYTDYRVCKQDYDNKVSELEDANTKIGGMISKAIQIGGKSDGVEGGLIRVLDDETSNNDLNTISKKAGDIDDLADGIKNDTIKEDIQDLANDIRSIKREIEAVVNSLKSDVQSIGNLAFSIQSG
jgi:chromosome segregation ATPase